ncbi:L-rhamnose mutarotase [Nocardiopsis sp. CNT312]|uniref:L-rhamnose mutarotase n=1 Tax=Nocardiopsis sp. CNT312 TaxID=1137268 RepID=UPI00048A6DAD|nr:L-rhamnose mutarotase [Nocardiopsis sp. CNT312]
MQRICFTLKVKKDRLTQYKEAHAAVWPEMREALSAAGWNNYSLFCTDEGLVIGYLETEDFEAARAAMETADVNARWQAEMAPLFEDIEGRADENMAPLPEIFHLD